MKLFLMVCSVLVAVGPFRDAAAAESPGVTRPAAKPDADPTLADIDAFIAAQKIDTHKPDWRTSLPKPPRFTFKTGALYDWVLRTNEGTIKIRLMPDLAPMHVSSTIYLTKLGFYDGLGFHRVVPGLTAQGGDPRGDGSGGPGYTYYSETSAIVKHDGRGLLSMANDGPDTDGSQFLLTFAATPSLDGTHSIFGEIVSGDDVLAKLEAAGSESGKPKEPLTIEKATIEIE